ncbi:MAG: UDP-N-acetylmuramoyl-L-alanyl-D-glutamate--2,6-diaminopimelate ligase [Ignavibacteriae bacterium]|nr:MAG: UDP-N-acetylmuramoyl-L-alanyl-D-glutamate--2,6-diaminopimelate ligase [Ignavibacteriota bacterium]
MKLSQLLEGVTVSKLFQTMYGQMVVTHDVEVGGVQYDSRKIQRSDCFVAIKGTSSDGQKYIQNAMNQGAKVIVLEDDTVLPDPLCMHAGVIKVVVPDSRKALAILAANYFGHPSKKMKCVGITGTNGKTTTSNLVKSIVEANGEKAGLVGTIEYKIGEQVFPATHTTPESLELNELFDAMVKNHCTSVSMEVSSHALDQSRVYGIEFDVAVFTNLTQDHLDYHGTMENYFEAKKRLFTQLKPSNCAVINHDDPWGVQLLGSFNARKISYGINSSADCQAKDIKLGIEGTTFIVRYGGQESTVTTPLIGTFNVYNVLAAYAAGLGLGLPLEQIHTGIKNLANVRGRFERIASPAGWTAIVDYAHTPDALENCLRTIHDVLPEKNRGHIITVFGAGGDRDKTKRPIMGRIAGEYSDLVIVTSDNPRTEIPETIIDDIMRGIIRHASVLREVDRRTAIERAVKSAQRGDVILVAGKGHEDYQIIGKEKKHFSDREVVESLLSRGG